MQNGENQKIEEMAISKTQLTFQHHMLFNLSYLPCKYLFLPLLMLHLLVAPGLHTDAHKIFHPVTTTPCHVC